MHYFSTNGSSPLAGFREAVLAGQADDKGLYFPDNIPRIPDELMRSLVERSKADIAFEVIRPYVDGDIPDDHLFDICSETVDFDFPLVPLGDLYALELFHGPTLAFKDVGARFMSRCLGYFNRDNDEKTIVVVATSGDTGGAVAAGFHNVDGIEVVILYPKGRVSRIQELQLTTLGGNVTTLELHGTFDDCQALAKKALADTDLRQRARFTSANSINVARWLPQQFYYFFALKQWRAEEAPVISVPSGNFGNLAAGMLAQASGLRVKKFVAACNANDVVPRYLETGVYAPRSTQATLSNAMDVGEPSNFVRIAEIFGKDLGAMRANLASATINDETTAATIREVYLEHGYILDPHGAVAYRALADDPDAGGTGISLETAHPVKFDCVNEIIGTAVAEPESVRHLHLRQKQSIEVGNDYDTVKDILLSKV
jgi:threonine synthase